ncbi:MAG TPA: helix-turn-helix domain-containing protein, partial [Candidatus Limnocylindria bacterium]|nr:helix-turn-helix domain-containing protein [Candidatus Limnocylindria bacterium]
MPALAADPTIRRQVMSAAREVLAEDASAPVAVIAGRAGVSRATFYRHFGSRASLLHSMELEPRPGAEARILAAARDMLVRRSLDVEHRDEPPEVVFPLIGRAVVGVAGERFGLMRAVCPAAS